MKSVRITIPIGIDMGPSGGVGNNYVTFYVKVPVRFTADDISRALGDKLEDVFKRWVNFGKD